MTRGPTKYKRLGRDDILQATLGSCLHWVKCEPLWGSVWGIRVSGSGSWQLVCVFQFCANDPEVFVQAALLAQDYCDAVDLNLGCPQMIAKRGEFLSGFLC